MPALDDINSVEETAAYLKLDPARVIELARKQKIAAIKQGRAWIFPRHAIEKYIEDHTIAAKPGNAWGLTDASTRRIRGRSA